MRFTFFALATGVVLAGCPSDPVDGGSQGSGDLADVLFDTAGDAQGDDAGDTTGDDDADTTGADDTTEPTGDDDADTGDVEPTEPSCGAYCKVLAQACTDDNEQFAGEAECNTYCQDTAQLPLGAAADTDVNSVGCRMYHAGVASQQEPEVHCPHAGPTGADTCGTWCENYCHLAMTNCTGANAVYDTPADCEAACADLVDDGEAGDTDGDTVQCRIYHAGVAGTNGDTSAEIHCPHAGPDGGGVCVDAIEPVDPTCEAYCAAITDACTGDNLQYADETACLTYCGASAQLPLGTSEDVDGNTVGCRIYHAGVASTSDENAAIHCVHAGPTGGDVCGAWCDNYCHLAQTNCSDDNALYSDSAACDAACADFPATGAAGDVDGDTVQCKIYHLGVAGSDGDDSAAVHCPHGGIDGGDVCVAPVLPPTCAEYCAAVQAACTDDNAQYASEDACNAYCQDWAQIPAGALSDTGGNTIGCRLYHAGVASASEDNAVVHCPHAGASGGDVCGTWCENYCHLAETNCTGDDALDFGDGDCPVACTGYGVDAAPGSVDGDSVQCRIYHLGVAGSDPPDSAGVHCPHGGLDGGGVCVPPPEPTTCTPIAALSCGDNLSGVSNNMDGSTNVMGDYFCSPFGDDYGTGPEATWSFEVSETTIVDISDGGAGEVDIFLLEDHGNGCEASEASCVLGEFDDLSFTAAPGATYYVVVDTWGGDDATFDLSVTCCTPSCTDKACGDDGCGSSCGDCGDGEVCNDAGACEEAVPTCEDYCAAVAAACTDDNAQYASVDACLNYCATWAQLPVGSLADTDTNTVGCRTYHAGVAALSEDDAAIHCPHAGPSGGNVCGSWCDNYCHLSSANCTDANALYADGDACSAACEAFPAVGEVADTSGNTVQCRIYHLGVAGSALPDSAGVHCPHGAVDGGGVCVKGGSTCEDAITVGALPYSDAGETDTASGDYSYNAGDCPGESSGWGAGSNDVVYAFTPETGGNHDIELTGAPGFDSNLYVVTDCGDIGSTCLAADDDIGSNITESITLNLTAGATYYIIVDGWNNSGNVSGAYTLTVDRSAPTCAEYCALIQSACTGDNAQYADEAVCLTYCTTQAQLVAGAAADVDGNTIGCRTYHAGVASLSDENAAVHCAHAGPSGGDVCGTWCDNYCYLAGLNCTGGDALFVDDGACGAACADFTDDAEPGAVSGDSVQCRIYHLGVAGFDADSPAIHCPHGGTDGGGVCVEAPSEGDTCESAFVVDAAPFSATGDTTGANADYAYGDGECPGETSGWGAASADQVYTFTPTASALYTITLEADADFDSNLYVVSDCGDIGSSCLAADDAIGGGQTESVAVNLTAGTTYFIVVDGWSNASDIAGAYTLSIDGGAPTCESYCADITAACTGDNAQYADADACLAYCTNSQLPIGATGDVDGNSLGCRTYHAGVAAQTDPAVHCIHAGPSGGDICGSWCDNYCHLAANNCSDGDALFGDDAACADACALYPLNGDAGDTVGNSVQCRIYHLGVAGDDTGAGPTVHCPHGSIDGGGVCSGPGGQTCEDAFAATGGLPYTSAGTTVGKSNDYSIQPQWCDPDLPSTSGAGSSDEAYVFTAPADGTYHVDVDVSFDALLYALGDCADAENTCLGGSDAIGGSANEHLELDMTAGESVYLVVDGWSSTSNISGDYSLTINGLGHNCALPHPISELPFSHTSSTNGVGNDASYSAGGCPGESFGWGAGSSDVVYAFTPGATGDYNVTLTGNNFDSNLYVVTDCGDIDGTCVGADDEVCANCTEELTLTLKGGTTYFIVADGFGNSNNVNGAYTLTVDLVGLQAPTCETYCADVTAACTGDNSQFADEAACLAYCGTWAQLDAGEPGDTDGNSIACRIYHAGVASADEASAAIHCDHAGPSGGNVCGSWCENYCDLAATNCAGDNALFADGDACTAACEAYDDLGGSGDTDGDTVQCRIYHLGVAGSDGDTSAAVHCPHGGIDGGGVCVYPGDNCDNPFSVGALPYTATGDTGQASPAVTNECVGATGDNGAGSNDHVYAFTPTADATYLITLQGAYDSLLYVASTCEFSGGACLGSDDKIGSNLIEAVTLQATAGTTYYIVVDGWSSSGNVSGTYTLTVEEKSDVELTCEYYCGLMTASCTADDAQYTDEAACLAYCGTWAAFPAGTVGDTAVNTLACRITAATDNGSGADCAAAGPSGGDSCGTWCDNYCYLSATNCSGGNALYASDAECQTACDNFSNGGLPGATDGDSVQCRIYHLGVAGSDGDTSAAVHCPHGATDGGGVCVAALGETCANPFLMEGVSFSASASTVGASGNYGYAAGECPGESSGWGAGSSDHVYAATPSFDGTWLVTLTGASFDSNLYVVTDCDDIGNSCVAANDEVCSSCTESVTVDATAGTTYYVIVDGWNNSSNTAGDYTLTVDLVGNTCETPNVVSALPFNATGDTNNATGDVNADGSCASVGAGSNDNVYSLTATADGPVTVTLDAAYDSALYVLTDCADAASCTASDDVIGVGVETLTFDATAGSTYFVVVDGWSNANNVAGSYSIEITQDTFKGTEYTVDIKDFAFAPADLTIVVGDKVTWVNLDATAHTATSSDDPPVFDSGTLAENDTYSFVFEEAGSFAYFCEFHAGMTGTITVEAPVVPGQTCDAPLVVDAVPYSATGDTTDASADYSYPAGACPGEGGSWGAASSDNAYAFTPTVTGSYTISLTNADGFDSNLYVVTDCSDIGASCLGADDQICSDCTETVVLDLTAGETYFIIVDGYSNNSNVAGAYTLTVDLTGDTCALPFAVDALPFDATGDTTGFSNALASPGSCPGDGGWGQAAPDHVYAYTPDADGTIDVSVTGTDFDTTLYVFSDCDDVENTCLGADDVIGSNTTESVSVAVTAGTTYFIVVDGYNNDATFGVEEGAYALSVTAAP